MKLFAFITLFIAAFSNHAIACQKTTTFVEANPKLFGAKFNWDNHIEWIKKDTEKLMAQNADSSIGVFDSPPYKLKGEKLQRYNISMIAWEEYLHLIFPNQDIYKAVAKYENVPGVAGGFSTVLLNELSMNGRNINTKSDVITGLQEHASKYLCNELDTNQQRAYVDNVLRKFYSK